MLVVMRGFSRVNRRSLYVYLLSPVLGTALLTHQTAAKTADPVNMVHCIASLLAMKFRDEIRGNDDQNGLKPYKA